MPASLELSKKFLALIKGEKEKHAVLSVVRPPDKSEFGFGQACGIYSGLHRAEQLFKQAIGEEEDRT